MSEPVRIQRPRRDHALALARDWFLAGRRVDMQSLAAELGVGRTTLYRWVGDREQLLAVVLSDLAAYLWADAEAGARGQGLDRVVDVIRRFAQLTSTWEATREFVHREPDLALRVLLGADSLVRTRVRDAVGRLVAEGLPDAPPLTPDALDAIVEVGMSLVWTPIAIGEEPGVERAVGVVRTLLEAHVGSVVG